MSRPAALELDPRLLDGARRSDPHGQRAFVMFYQARLLAFCARIVGPHAAEDCAQETLVKALGALPRFDPAGGARPSTWLLTIGTRVCIDALRKERRPLPPAELVAPQETLDAEPAALERALRQRIEAAIAALPDDLRATFVLRVTADRSVEESARVLGVDEGTIKSRLSRARARLREAIGEV